MPFSAQGGASFHETETHPSALHTRVISCFTRLHILPERVAALHLCISPFFLQDLCVVRFISDILGRFYHDIILRQDRKTGGILEIWEGERSPWSGNLVDDSDNKAAKAPALWPTACLWLLCVFLHSRKLTRGPIYRERTSRVTLVLFNKIIISSKSPMELLYNFAYLPHLVSNKKVSNLFRCNLRAYISTLQPIDCNPFTKPLS